MKYNIQKKHVIFVCSITWIFLCAAINVYPINIFEINSLLNLVNSSRILLPIIFGPILFIILILNLKLDNLNPKLFNFTYIFFIIILTQSIGTILFNRYGFQDFYLIVFSLITILLFLLIENFELQKIYKIFLYIILLYISLAAIFLFVIKFETFKLYVLSGSFYGVFHPDVSLIGQSSLRATGYSRLIAIISLFLIFFSEQIKNTYFKYILFLSNFILALCIWMFQSRGTILCYYSSIFIITFIYNFRDKLIDKFKILSLTIFLPLMLSALIISLYPLDYQKLEDNKTNELVKDNEVIELDKTESFEEIFKNNKGKQRALNNFSSTGRLTLWENSIKYYDKKKFFGYGSQADRIILGKVNKLLYSNANPYGNNVSNGLVYSFLSGGYLSLILFFLIYVINLIVGLKILRINFNKELDPIIKFSSIIVFFFSLRSLFENSYAVFSIDFLLIFIGISILNDFLRNKKI